MKRMFFYCRNIKKISVGDNWTINAVEDSMDMFAYCNSLVGGAETRYDEDHVDAEYARVDGGESLPGYFTYKEN